MRVNSILDRYIFFELIPPFTITLGFFTFVFLMAQMLKITDLIVNYHVSLFIIFKILMFSTPYFMVFVIPMSTMMSIILTFLRLSGDHEITALKYGGIGIYRLLVPVMAFSLLTGLLTLFMAGVGMPHGKRAIKALTFKVFSSNLDIGLKERTFNDSFNDVMMYVNKIDVKTKTLIDVFIEDKREENVVSTVVAPKGKLFSDPDNYIFQLRLTDGIINQVDLKHYTTHSISFDTYDIRLDFQKAVAAAGEGKGRKEMSIGELREYIRSATVKNEEYYKIQMEYYQKFSIPFACIALAVLGVPLGIQSRSAKPSSGLILGIVFFMLYYVLLSFGKVFGETGDLPPVIGMWVPNIVMGSLGMVLLLITAGEKKIRIGLPFYRLQRLVHRT